MQAAVAPEQEPTLQCPRCESINTKFCYYNNYNLSQPRHFCKDCRRYWTKGGSLRNIPVGGATRKNSKRSSSGDHPKRPSPACSSPGELKRPDLSPSPFHHIDEDHRMLDMTGSFSSLLSSSAQFGNLFECYHSLDSLPILNLVNRPLMANSPENRAPPLPESFLGLAGDPSGWAGGWTDLSIYTPGESFH